MSSKVAYLLTCNENQSLEQLNSALLEHVSAQLRERACAHFTINVFDEKVEAAKAMHMQRQQPPINAVVFVWCDNESEFKTVEQVLNTHVTVLSGYALEEFSRIPATPQLQAQQTFNGARTPGMMQLAFLKVPERLEYDEWLSIWRNLHTQVAIDIQSTFIYRQNVIKQCVAGKDIGFTAIVEEAFPVEAMTSQRAFYDAQTDVELVERQTAMWKSSKRFIDLHDLDVLPTSEYCW